MEHVSTQPCDDTDVCNRSAAVPGEILQYDIRLSEGIFELGMPGYHLVLGSVILLHPIILDPEYLQLNGRTQLQGPAVLVVAVSLRVVVFDVYDEDVRPAFIHNGDGHGD